jgi:hypothetical protein
MGPPFLIAVFWADGCGYAATVLGSGWSCSGRRQVDVAASVRRWADENGGRDVTVVVIDARTLPTAESFATAAKAFPGDTGGGET